MAVRILNKDLPCPIRPLFHIVQQRSTGVPESVRSGFGIIYEKCKVITPSRTNCGSGTDRRTLRMLFDQMDQSITRLKPRTSETERGACDLFQAFRTAFAAAAGQQARGRDIGWRLLSLIDRKAPGPLSQWWQLSCRVRRFSRACLRIRGNGPRSSCCPRYRRSL